MKYLLLGAWLLLLNHSLTSQKRKWLWGGDIGLAIPSNIGEKEYNIGFKDVAQTGPRISLTSRWFYAKTLTLGAELTFSTFSQNNRFWDINNYGTVKNTYNMGSASIEGDYYFSHDEFRPYVGMAFGAYVLSNSLTFKSAYEGTTEDASASYNTTIFKPGFAPSAGFLLAVSKRSFLYSSLKFEIIPNLKPNIIEETDEYGNTRTVTQNPHSHENHWSLSIGYLFNTK
jgi:outer membrane protein W